MKISCQIIFFLSVLLGGAYAHSSQVDAIEKHIEEMHLGKVYGVQVIFDSSASREESEIRHIVYVWGGYDRGWCSPSGACGCATNTNITWLRLDGKNKASDSRKLTDDCKGGDSLQVGFSEQFVALSNSERAKFSPHIIFDTYHPDLGFQESGATLDLASKFDYQPVSSPTEVENQFPSPGFSCSKAKSFVEIQICSSMRLSQIDRDMSEIYRKIQTNSNDEVKAAVRAQQTEHIRRRSSCMDIRCIERATIGRIGELSVRLGLEKDRASK